MKTIMNIQDNLDKVRTAIMADSENLKFTKQGWVPIFQIFPEAKIVIIGPAPSIKTQKREEVFRDISGDRLRDWMGISEETFYQSHKIAVLPLDFYFPGKSKTGDLPPRYSLAKKWHPTLLAFIPTIELTILIGLHSQKFYLKNHFKGTLTATVCSYQDYLPEYFPLVHPSPLNFRWLNHNPDFEKRIVPALRKIVKNILNEE